MKKLLFLLPFLFLAPKLYASVTINGQCYNLLWNPWTGTNQYVTCPGGGSGGPTIPSTYTWTLPYGLSASTITVGINVTLGDVTNLVVTPVVDPSPPADCTHTPNNGYPFYGGPGSGGMIFITAYKTVNGQKVFSSHLVNYSYGGFWVAYGMSASWTPVSGADGYRIFFGYSAYSTRKLGGYIDTALNSFYIGYSTDATVDTGAPWGECSNGTSWYSPTYAELFTNQKLNISQDSPNSPAVLNGLVTVTGNTYVTGSSTAAYFYGNGSNLTGIPAGNPFDQNLNTTDSPTFGAINANTGINLHAGFLELNDSLTQVGTLFVAQTYLGGYAFLMTGTGIVETLNNTLDNNTGAMEANTTGGIGTNNSSFLMNNNIYDGYFGNTDKAWGLEINNAFSSQGLIITSPENGLYPNTNSLSLLDSTAGTRWNFALTSANFQFNKDGTSTSFVFGDNGTFAADQDDGTHVTSNTLFDVDASGNGTFMGSVTSPSINVNGNINFSNGAYIDTNDIHFFPYNTAFQVKNDYGTVVFYANSDTSGNSNWVGTLNNLLDDGSGNANFMGSATATTYYGDGSNLTGIAGGGGGGGGYAIEPATVTIQSSARGIKISSTSTNSAYELLYSTSGSFASNYIHNDIIVPDGGIGNYDGFQINLATAPYPTIPMSDFYMRAQSMGFEAGTPVTGFNVYGLTNTMEFKGAATFNNSLAVSGGLSSSQGTITSLNASSETLRYGLKASTGVITSLNVSSFTAQYGLSASTGVFTSTVTAPYVAVSTIGTITQIKWADGTIQISSPPAGGSGGLIGVYNATATAGFPLGFTASTGTITSLNLSSVTVNAGATSVGGISLNGTAFPAITMKTNGSIIGYSPFLATSNGGFFSDSLVGDQGFRSESNRLLFGVGSGNSMLQVSGSGVGFGSSGAMANITASGMTVGSSGQPLTVTTSGVSTYNPLSILNSQIGSSPVDSLILANFNYPTSYNNSIASSISGTPADSKIQLNVANGASTRATVMTLSGDGVVTIPSVVKISGGTTQLYYCNGGVSLNQICRGNGCTCVGGTEVAEGIYVP